jgi:hypothetical protein
MESGRWLALKFFSWAGRILSKALGQSNALVEKATLRFGGLDDFIPIDISDAVLDTEHHDNTCLDGRVEWTLGIDRCRLKGI